MRNHPIPIVGVNEHLEDLPVPVTTVDNLSTSRAIVRHLLELGHRKIGHVTGTTTLSSGRDRLDGILERTKAARLIRHGFATNTTMLNQAEKQLKNGYA